MPGCQKGEGGRPPKPTALKLAAIVRYKLPSELLFKSYVNWCGGPSASSCPQQATRTHACSLPITQNSCSFFRGEHANCYITVRNDNTKGDMEIKRLLLTDEQVFSSLADGNKVRRW